MSKPASAFRIDPDLLAQARKQKLNLVDVIEAAIAKALKTKRCPYCNSILNKETPCQKKKQK